MWGMDDGICHVLLKKFKNLSPLFENTLNTVQVLTLASMFLLLVLHKMYIA
ncbi:hypothetical protein Bca101_040905 [Brassica carinata]